MGMQYIRHKLGSHIYENAQMRHYLMSCTIGALIKKTYLSFLVLQTLDLNWFQYYGR